MDAADHNEMFERAVDAARRASSADDYDAMCSMLVAIGDEPAAIEAAFLHLRSDDAIVRATACDLVRVICEGHEEPREPAVAALLELVGEEGDIDVLYSAARALGATATDRAIPALLAQARSSSEDVRLAVAVALPACSVENVQPAAVAALIELAGDSDADVRNWATFALGRQLDFDSAALRDALWKRVTDENQDVREEAITGLARRRDQDASARRAAAGLGGCPELVVRCRGVACRRIARRGPARVRRDRRAHCPSALMV